MPIPNEEFFRDLQAMRRDWMFSRKPVIGRGRPPHHAVLVELLEDLLPGQSAQAVILEGSPGSEASTNVRIECYDSLLVTGQIDAETKLFARPIAGLWQVDRTKTTDDLADIPSYEESPATAQILVNTPGTGLEWIDIDEALQLLPGYTASSDQSIGHDASGDPEWQDDAECE